MKKLIIVMFFLIMFFLAFGFASASTVTRSFSSNIVEVCSEVNVTLRVDVTGDDTYYLIDEVFPAGWNIVNSGGGSNAEAGHLKWYVLNGAVDTEYNYIVNSSCDIGIHEFNGKYGFDDAIVYNITGDSLVEVTNSSFPVIKDIYVSSISNESAVIYWEVNKVVNSTLRYGISSGVYDSYMTLNLSGFSFAVLIEGLEEDNLYYYVIEAYDSEGKSSTSYERSFKTLNSDTNYTVIIDDRDWNNKSTNFSSFNRTQLGNLSNVRLENAYGVINYLQNISILRNINLFDNIKFTQYKVFVNSSAIPEFNRSASLKFKNIYFEKPNIRRNGVDCREFCYNPFYNVSSKEYEFEIIGFSEYEIYDLCSDGIKSGDEIGVDCGGSCSASCYNDENTGGGGSSSGGGYSSTNDIVNNTNQSFVNNTNQSFVNNNSLVNLDVDNEINENEDKNDSGVVGGTTITGRATDGNSIFSGLSRSLVFILALFVLAGLLIYIFINKERRGKNSKYYSKVEEAVGQKSDAPTRI